MNDYLKIVYDEGSHPYTEYPEKLCNYLYQSFNMRTGMRLLEPGCGRGEFLGFFKKLGLDVHGIDISPEAPKLTKDIPVKVGNIEKDELPYPDNYFDIVYSKSFLEHLQEPGHFLKEAYRVLKPGGILLSLVPDWESNYKIYFDDYTHKTPFTIISLRDAYLIHGFMEVNAYKFRQLPIVWKYPALNYFCAAISPLIPIRTNNKFLRWSRELMLIGYGKKPDEDI